MVDKFDNRYIAAGVVIIILAFIAGMHYSEMKISKSREEEQNRLELQLNDQLQKEEAITAKQSEYIEVFVGGAVKTPMICKLPKGSRVYQAVELAQAQPDADLTQVDMARVLQDGETVVVYRQDDILSNSVGNSAVNSGRVSNNSSGKVNINRASAQEMAQRLSGIGEVLAQRIVEYREANGSFVTEKDICNVSGIGEKRYESIKDMITVK